MSKPKPFEKPIGLTDYIPPLVEQLRQVETTLLECMARWGYREVKTPTLEFYDTVGVASATDDQKLFKLLDRWGTTLVLRSDMTAPIARVVGSLLRHEPPPLRLSYHANVFRRMAEETSRSSEYWQTGAELIGDDTAEADAETIALAIDCLQAVGVTSFRMAVGHVDFVDGLFRECFAEDDAPAEQLKQHLLLRNYVEYRQTLHTLDIEESMRMRLAQLLSLRGGEEGRTVNEVFSQAKGLTTHRYAHEALDHLSRVWRVLSAYGIAEHVMVDLTMIGNLQYYTGLTFEGYTQHSAFPIVNGGRYDHLLSFFGRAMPARGFALKTDRLLESLWASTTSKRPLRKTMLVLYRPTAQAEALAFATVQRQRQDVAVTTRCVYPDAREWTKDATRMAHLHEQYDVIYRFGIAEQEGGGNV